MTIMPWMMQPNEAKVVGEVLAKVLSSPPPLPKLPKGGKPADVDGQWNFEMGFVLAPTQHKVVFEQNGDTLLGLHQGERTGGDLSGWVTGDTVQFSSRHRWEGGSFGFNFTGKVSGDTMTGEVDMGEYFTAPFTAKRHAYGRRQQPQRPQKNV